MEVGAALRVLSVILGVMVLFSLVRHFVVAAALFGAYLLISGIAQVVFAFSLHTSAGGRILLFISGAASLILAILAFRHFGEGYALPLRHLDRDRVHLPRVATTATALGEPVCRDAAGTSSSAWSASSPASSCWPTLLLAGNAGAGGGYLADHHRGV